jgi:N6-adenosine-specific RNA methylase IME4
VHDRIEEMLPNGPYVELFARQHNLRRGWVSVGDQLQ